MVWVRNKTPMIIPTKQDELNQNRTQPDHKLSICGTNGIMTLFICYLRYIINFCRIFTVFATYNKLVTREIDFVAERNGLKIYIQVCLQITEKTTLSHEFGNLLMINENYPKYVITLNDLIIGNDYQGIKQMNLLDFLLFEL